MIYKPIALLVCMLFASVGLSQDGQNYLYLGTGYHTNKIQDHVFSPMIYNGGSPGLIELAYQKRTQKWLYTIEIRYDQAKVEPPELISFQLNGRNVTRESSKEKYLNVRLNYGREVYKKNAFDLLAGIGLTGQVQLVDYNFGLSTHDGYVYAYSLSPILLGRLKLNDGQSIMIETSYPLLSYVVRPQYAIVDNGAIQNRGSDIQYFHTNNGHVESIGQVHNLDFKLSYSRELSPRWDVIIGYHFHYFNYGKALNVSIRKDSFSTGIRFKLSTQ